MATWCPETWISLTPTIWPNSPGSGNGALLIQQYLRAGVVDEFILSVAPVLFGDGQRLFEGTGAPSVTLTDTIASADVTHVRYTVNRAPGSGLRAPGSGYRVPGTNR